MVTILNGENKACKEGKHEIVVTAKVDNVIEEISKLYTSNLTYIDTFTKIMEVNDNNKNFSYKVAYNTVDGVHWNSTTSKYYVNLMLNLSNIY